MLLLLYGTCTYYQIEFHYLVPFWHFFNLISWTNAHSCSWAVVTWIGLFSKGTYEVYGLLSFSSKCFDRMLKFTRICIRSNHNAIRLQYIVRNYCRECATAISKSLVNLLHRSIMSLNEVSIFLKRHSMAKNRCCQNKNKHIFLDDLNAS